MILIFGGTTEGRLAIDVCEEAGKTFYYSTKGSGQVVEMHNGVRLSGSMTSEDIRSFCALHDIRCIIDASHPFAEGLHQSIAEATSLPICYGDDESFLVPVIRLQRQSGEYRSDVVYCNGFDDAIIKLQSSKINKLLALSGANTIVKLKPFWESCNTVFRILNRDESIQIALRNGLTEDNLIFYNNANELPSFDEEVAIMQRLGCDAMITKESGKSGGMDTKINAALSLGMKVFVVRAPLLTFPWDYVTGRYGLRRAIEKYAPDFFPLKTGFTTGACATAATKAALLSLMSGECPEEVSFSLPNGEIMSIPVSDGGCGWATVVKDFSDDPDVLRGCRITSRVRENSNNEKSDVSDSYDGIRFLKGDGVGVVTLPGLGIPVGEPAVNPTPRRMIVNEIRSLSSKNYDVTISVEDGEALSLRTFNHKVGVIGGVSIIGTSGIVHPLSNEAFIQSLRRELEVARAIGCRSIGLVAGMKSERTLRDLEPKLRCVHYGNSIGEALSVSHELGFERVVVSIMIGKAVKLAEGNLDTHSHKVQLNKDFLCSLAPEFEQQIRSITMARELIDFMPETFFEKIKSLCYDNCRRIFPTGKLDVKVSLM